MKHIRFPAAPFALPCNLRTAKCGTILVFRSPSGAPILDLPGVIEKVPGHTAGDIAWRPSLLAGRRGSRGRLNRIDDHLSPCPYARPVFPPGRLRADSELRGIRRLGIDDVVRDLVAVPPAAARALAQLGRRLRDNCVEHLPRGGEQRVDSLGLVFRKGLHVTRGMDARRTEISGGI